MESMTNEDRGPHPNNDPDSSLAKPDHVTEKYSFGEVAKWYLGHAVFCRLILCVRRERGQVGLLTLKIDRAT